MTNKNRKVFRYLTLNHKNASGFVDTMSTTFGKKNDVSMVHHEVMSCLVPPYSTGELWNLNNGIHYKIYIYVLRISMYTIYIHSVYIYRYIYRYVLKSKKAVHFCTSRVQRK
jgi:hypothetical protein